MKTNMGDRDKNKDLKQIEKMIGYLIFTDWFPNVKVGVVRESFEGLARIIYDWHIANRKDQHEN